MVQLKDWQLPAVPAVEAGGILVVARSKWNWMYWDFPAPFAVTKQSKPKTAGLPEGDQSALRLVEAPGSSLGDAPHFFCQ